jgi:Uma2 family endonuclease
MVDGNPLEEEPMTAVMLPVDPRLLERDDLTVDDLTSLPEDLRYELINGRLVLSPHALSVHKVIGRRTAEAIEDFCPDEFVVDQEQAILLNRSNEVCPDVSLLRIEGANRSPVLATDVLLVVEVVSQSSRISDYRDKRETYERIGIPGYWIIDPLKEQVTLTELRLGPGGYRQRLQTSELITLEEPWKITLDLPAWTRRRNRIWAAARP